MAYRDTLEAENLKLKAMLETLKLELADCKVELAQRDRRMIEEQQRAERRRELIEMNEALDEIEDEKRAEKLRQKRLGLFGRVASESARITKTGGSFLDWFR